MESNTYYLTQLLENKFIRKLIVKACADKHQIDFHYACDFITTWCPNVDSAVMQIKFSFSSLNYADDLWSLKCSLSLDCQHVYKEFMIKLLIWAVHLCPTQKYLKMAWVFFLRWINLMNVHSHMYSFHSKWKGVHVHLWVI